MEDIDNLAETPGPVSNQLLFDAQGELLSNLQWNIHYSAVLPEVDLSLKFNSLTAQFASGLRGVCPALWRRPGDISESV